MQLINYSGKKAAVLWSGGKDCCLALARCMDEGVDVVSLVTLVPENAKQFHAHPQDIILEQAGAIGISHQFVTVYEPFKEGYEEAFRQLKEQGIELLVTGDISEVHGNTNWVSDRAEGIIDVWLPLWYGERELLIQEEFDRGIKCYFSLVYKEQLPKDFIGRVYDQEALEELKILEKEKGVDICGENGEFHTMVFNAPFYQKKIEIPQVIIEEEKYWRLER